MLNRSTGSEPAYGRQSSTAPPTAWKRSTQSIEAIFPNLTDHAEDRKMLLALAAAELATAAFEEAALALDHLPPATFVDFADESHDDIDRRVVEDSLRIDGNLPHDVADITRTLVFFRDLLTLTTGLRPRREFVQALLACRPIRTDSSGSTAAGDSLNERVQARARIMWPIQEGLHWLQIAIDSLNAYNASLAEVTTVPAAAVAPVCLERVAGFMESALLRTNYTSGDLTPFMEWAGVLEWAAAEAGNDQDDDDEAPAVAVEAATGPAEAARANDGSRPCRFREFL